MANYDNRGGNSRFGGGKGRSKFSGNNFRKPSFAKKSWGDDRSDSRPANLHQATCAECSRMCEVPFRPTGERPVYCKECFENRGGNTGGESGGNKFPKKDFFARDSARPSLEKSGSSDVVVKQLETMNTKLDRLIRAVEAFSSNNTFEEKRESKEP